MGSEAEDCNALQDPPALFFLHSLHFPAGDSYIQAAPSRRECTSESARTDLNEKS